MRAMILAAGFGTRLRPLTNATPKPLLPVGGTPLIVWNLLLLRRYGIREVIINLHHLGSMIENELGNGHALGMRISYSPEPSILGTGGGIKQAEDFFKGEPFLVVNGDTLFELDLGNLVRFHEQHHPLATMVVREDPEAEKWGVLELDEGQRVVRINGRGRDYKGSTTARMFAGIHVLHPRLLATVPMAKESSIIEAYTYEIARGEQVLGYHFNGYWSDVGTPARYAETQRAIDEGIVNLIDRAFV